MSSIVQGHRKIAEEAAKRKQPGGAADNATVTPSAAGGSDSGAAVEEYRIIQDNPVEEGAAFPPKAAEPKLHITATTQLGVKPESEDNPFAVSPTASNEDLVQLAQGKSIRLFVAIITAC